MKTEGEAYNKRRQAAAAKGPKAVAEMFSREPAVARKLAELRAKDLYGSNLKRWRRGK